MSTFNMLPMSLRRCLPGLILLAMTACSPGAPPAFAEVVVRGTDYAFMAPDTVSAGLTAFSFVNTGKMRHEVKLIALRSGVDPRTAMPLAMKDSGWTELRHPTSGILTAASGDTTPGRLLAMLKPGERYFLVCHFADSDSAPLHSELGMIRQLVVK